MDWREERISDIESNLQKILKLLREYEHDLMLENDPAKKSFIEDRISDLKTRMAEYKNELESLKETPQTERDIALKMTNINFDDINFVISALLRQNINTVIAEFT
jgi:DNA repair exonuclease SbcCD ATPase subunit